MTYEEFIESKKLKMESSGFVIDEKHLNPACFPYQREIIKRACEKGKYALFVDTGLGKSIMQMNFAFAVVQHTHKPVLILAPLAVVFQMQKEASKFGFDVKRYKKDEVLEARIYISNYDQLDNIDTSEFVGVVLDESSILKSLHGSTKQALIERFANTSYKLACSATPSPNDFTELGNHSEFLNILSSKEMLARFFINDTANTGEWRIKKHAQDAFFEWVGEWAECVSSPADLGYDGSSHVLPPLLEKLHFVEFDDVNYLSDDVLFAFAEVNATTLGRNKKASLDKRIHKFTSEILTNSTTPFLLWVDTNIESDDVHKAIKNKFPELAVVSIKGSDDAEFKANMLNDFAQNKIDVLITKSSIAGMGMNFQNAHNMGFLGLNYSYERYYQAVRRMYRFGQNKPVNVHIILADNEISIWEAILKKKDQHDEMKKNMTRKITELKTHKICEISKIKSLSLPSFLKEQHVG